MTFTTNNIKLIIGLLERVLDAPDYEGRQFEIDNILVWLKLETRVLEIELQPEKTSHEKRNS